MDPRGDLGSDPGRHGFSRDDIGNFINSSGDAYPQGAFTNWATDEAAHPVGSKPRRNLGDRYSYVLGDRAPRTSPGAGSHPFAGANFPPRRQQLLTVTPPPPPVAMTTAAPSAAPASERVERHRGADREHPRGAQDPAPWRLLASKKPTAAQLAPHQRPLATSLISSNLLLQSVQNQALAGRMPAAFSTAARRRKPRCRPRAGGRPPRHRRRVGTFSRSHPDRDEQRLRLWRGNRCRASKTSGCRRCATTPLTTQAQPTCKTGDQLDFARRDAAAVRATAMSGGSATWRSST